MNPHPDYGNDNILPPELLSCFSSAASIQYTTTSTHVALQHPLTARQSLHADQAT